MPEQLLVGGPSNSDSYFIGIAVSCAVSVVVALGRRRTTQGPGIAGAVAIILADLTGLSFTLYGRFGAAYGTAGPGLGVYAGLVASGFLMLVGGLLIGRCVPGQTLVVGSVAGVLVAGSTWWLTAMDSSAPIRGGAEFTDDGWLAWPDEGTTSDQKRKIGYDTCAAQSVESLARLLNELKDARGRRPTAGSDSRGDAHYFGDQEELYAGCLQAFRDKR